MQDAMQDAGYEKFKHAMDTTTLHCWGETLQTRKGDVSVNAVVMRFVAIRRLVPTLQKVE